MKKANKLTDVFRVEGEDIDDDEISYGAIADKLRNMDFEAVNTHDPSREDGYLLDQELFLPIKIKMDKSSHESIRKLKSVE